MSPRDAHRPANKKKKILILLLFEGEYEEMRTDGPPSLAMNEGTEEEEKEKRNKRRKEEKDDEERKEDRCTKQPLNYTNCRLHTFLFVRLFHCVQNKENWLALQFKHYDTECHYVIKPLLYFETLEITTRTTTTTLIVSLQ